MAVSTTKIKGSLRDSQGKPYEGALIKIYLSNSIEYPDDIVGKQIASIFTNSYGVFQISLVPTLRDGETSSDTYYVFEIIEETTTIYRKVIPYSSTTLNFEDLEDYVLPSQRTLYIGRGSDTDSPSGVSVDIDLTGIFKWTSFDGDGTTTTFIAPGQISIVSLNGILLIEGIDYSRSRYDTVVLDDAPGSGSILSIQYKA